MLKSFLKGKLKRNAALAMLIAFVLNFTSILPASAQGPFGLNIYACITNNQVCDPATDTMISGASLAVQDKNETMSGVTNGSGLYVADVNPQTVKITLDVGSVTSQAAYANAFLTSQNPVDTSFGGDANGGDYCTQDTEGLNFCYVDPGVGGNASVYFTFKLPEPIIPTPGGSDISNDPCLDTSKPLPDSCKPPVTDPCLDPLKPVPDSCKPPVTDPCLDTSAPLPPECTPSYSGGGDSSTTSSQPEMLAETGGPNIFANLFMGMIMIMAAGVLFIRFTKKEKN